MKRAVLTVVFMTAVAALGGCPIYNHEDDGCWRDRDCAPGYLCDDNTGDCYVPGPGQNSCVRPADCGVNQTCATSGRCVSGDCSFNGCVAGFRCDSSTGIWQCVSTSSPVPPADGGASGSDSGGASSSGGAGGSGGTSAEIPSAGANSDSAGVSGAGEAGGG